MKYGSLFFRAPVRQAKERKNSMDLTLEELRELGVTTDVVSAQIDQLNNQINSIEGSLAEKKALLEQVSRELAEAEPQIMVLQTKLQRWQSVQSQMNAEVAAG